MNNFTLSKEKEIELFVLCIWLFLIRIAIPYAKYFFVPYFAVFITYTIIRTIKVHHVTHFKSYYLQVFSPFLVICIFFIIGVLLSSTLDFYFLKEGLAMFVLVCIVFMAFIYINNEDDSKLFTRVFIKQLLAFCILICLFSLVKLFFLLRGVRFGFLYDLNGLYPNGTSLVIDYNFYALVNLLGIVSASFLLVKARSAVQSVLLQVLVFGMIFNVIFSTSRRGMFVLVLMILVFSCVLFFGWMAKKGTWMTILSRRLRLVFILSIGFIFLMGIFLSQRPFHSESSRYVDLGFDRTTGKELLYLCATRYFTIIDPQYKDAAIHQYFKRFRATGQIGEFNHLSEFSDKSNALNSTDSSRLNISRGVKKDTYFTGILDDPDNLLSGGRLQRVNFGIKIFSERYSPLKKITGGGFDYLRDFGNEFYIKNNHRFYFDYPHNPILSAFLYSGILGGVSMIYFFIITFLNFIRGFRSLIYFICLYVIIFFFAFFSGNSIFGNPEFVFISLIPFYFIIVRDKEVKMSTMIPEK
jgi:O-antigen ligase